MIDTIRFTGPARYYRFNYSYEKFQGFRRADGEERITQVMVEDIKGVHRVFYTLSTDTIVVELNPQKLMFGDNVYNYEKNTAILNDFVRLVGGVYFDSSDYYVSRVDLGSVTTFPSVEDSKMALERFRSARLDGARIGRFKQQNYKDSVFYPSRNFSVKIYRKGVEMGIKPQDETDDDGNPLIPESMRERNRLGFDLLATLRCEKTYRFNEMKRLGVNYAMRHILPLRYDATDIEKEVYREQVSRAKRSAPMQVTPYKGVHIDSFDIGILVEDYFNTFEKWEFNSTPYLTHQKGSAGLLSIIENNGQLAEVESLGVVSRKTIHRYKKKKRKVLDFTPTLTFSNNMSQKVSQMWYYYRTFGINSLIVSP